MPADDPRVFSSRELRIRLKQMMSCSYCRPNTSENSNRHTDSSLRSRIFDRMKNGLKFKPKTKNKNKSNFDWQVMLVKEKRENKPPND